MKKFMLALLICIFLLSGCNSQEKKADLPAVENSYTQITAQEAKSIMEKAEHYILLDVRTENEFHEGHIEGAIPIPNTEIRDRAETELIDKDVLILVYCRSGNRSRQAAQTLVEMGYTNIYDFSGITDWPYEIMQ